MLQENRVLLPGVQILVAFLVTVPFNDRFVELDGFGEGVWACALAVGCLAIVCLMTPIVFHRFGDRRNRSSRLVWGIRTQRGGIITFGASLLLSVVFVTRFVSGLRSAMVMVAILVVAMGTLWLLLPLRDSRSGPGQS